MTLTKTKHHCYPLLTPVCPSHPPCQQCSDPEHSPTTQTGKHRLLGKDNRTTPMPHIHTMQKTGKWERERRGRKEGWRGHKPAQPLHGAYDQCATWWAVDCESLRVQSRPRSKLVPKFVSLRTIYSLWNQSILGSRVRVKGLGVPYTPSKSCWGSEVPRLSSVLGSS